MTKSILSISLKTIITFALIQGGLIFAQNAKITGEQFEQLASHLQSGLAQVQKNVGANDADFQTFEKFNEKRINTEKGYLGDQAREGKINATSEDEAVWGTALKF